MKFRTQTNISALISTQTQNCFIRATKWANKDVITRFFQKVVNKRFKEFRHFLHLIGEFIKFLYTNQNIGIYFYKISKYALLGQQNGLI